MNPPNRRKSASTAVTSSSSMMPPSARKDATRKRIEQMEAEREERRKEMIQRKQARKQEQLKNLAAGNPGDVDFIGMVQEWRRKQQLDYQKKQQQTKNAPPPSHGSGNICIAVRKRPVSDKERQKLDHDSVSSFPPKVWIHSAKFKVDGISKYLTHTAFQFDHAFAENATTEQIYMATTLPLVDHVVSTQGRATVFCYGQTGSGKTYTMNGIQQILAYDLYGQLEELQAATGSGLEITVAFFELYGGFIQDLLHQRQRCKLLEDGQGEVNITGLQEVPAPTPEEFLQVIEEGHSLRTTHTTEANDTSSRSHAICQVLLRENGKLRGKLSLVDLAGSERGSDTKSHNAQRRAESADINTSLLSLKECMRALGQKSSHVPYRGSKLTLILKDCFSENSKTTMIATISPGASSTDHSLNTLRYSDRIKEQRTTSTSTKKGQPRGGGVKARPQALPSKERLGRINAANSLAKEHRQDAIQGVLAQQNKTLSRTGLVESLESSVLDEFNEIDEFEDDPAPALLAESTSSLTEDNYYPAVDMVAPSMSQESASGSSTIDSFHSSQQPGPTEEEDEAEMRRTVQALFVLEEALLNQHMSNIQENAEMLTQEGKLLQKVQAGGLSEAEMDEYAIQLAEYLDRKEVLIYKLQSKLTEFHMQLAKEQQLAQRVTKLTQY